MNVQKDISMEINLMIESPCEHLHLGMQIPVVIDGKMVMGEITSLTRFAEQTATAPVRTKVGIKFTMNVGVDL